MKDNPTIIDSPREKKKSRSFLYFIFAVLCAVLLWFYVAGVDTEISEKKFTSVTVALKNEDSMLAQHGFAVLYGRNVTADITVTGKRSQMTQLRQSDINVYVDLASVNEAGEHKLTVQADLPDGMTLTSCYPQSITVYADQSTTKSVPVLVQVVRMTKNDDLELSDPVLSSSMVNVTGPGQLLATVDHALVSLDLGTVTASFETMGSVVLVDDGGDELESDYIRTDVKDITVGYSVYKKKSVPLKVGFERGYLDSERVSVKISPETVVVRGDPDLIDALTEIEVYKVDELTLTDAGTSTTIAVGSIPMPSGISLDSAGGAAFVEIGVKPLNSSRTVPVQLYQPNLTVRAPEGMEYNVNKDVLEITVRGDAADLEGVSSSDVRLTMDLSGFTTEGIKTGVPVTVDQTSLRAKNCYATGDYSITVTVTDPGGASDG